MAKRKALKPETSTMPDSAHVVALPLSAGERARAERVLSSQGRAIGLLDCFPLAMQRELASWCGISGALQPGVREAVAELIANFYAEQKADVEEDKPTGFGLPEATPQPEAGQPNK